MSIIDIGETAEAPKGSAVARSLATEDDDRSAVLSVTEVSSAVMRSVGGRATARVRDRLRALRALVLLDGTVRRSPFAEAVGRSLLDLPLESGRVLLDMWHDEIGEASDALGLRRRLPCRIVLGRTMQSPALRPRDQETALSVEMDPSELRGTGGVLRDLARQYDDDDLLVVGNAAQLLLHPLRVLLTRAAERGGDVTVLANADGTPSSLMLIACRALRALPAVGFVDLKEQGLPQIAGRFDVRIQSGGESCGLPIRTARDYLAALRAYCRLHAGDGVDEPPFADRGCRHFQVVEEGAKVQEGADLHDTVVLRNARVGRGALVANSIVCGGGVIQKGERVVGQLVAAVRRTALEREER